MVFYFNLSGLIGRGLWRGVAWRGVARRGIERVRGLRDQLLQTCGIWDKFESILIFHNKYQYQKNKQTERTGNKQRNNGLTVIISGHRII